MGHGSILAPLTATVATTLALGLGIALARAERERRRRGKQRKLQRRFAPLAQEPPGVGLRRMALGQLDSVIEALTQNGGSPEKRVHEARKALKRLRALLRLVREELGEQTFERELALVRDVGQQLAGARDAAVLLATLEDLIARQPKQFGRRRGVRRLRAELRGECEGAAERALAESVRERGTLAELWAMRVRVERWRLEETSGLEAVEPALERLYVQGRKRMRRAAKAKGSRRRMRRLHEWRKRVKDLRYAQEMLGAGKHAKRADALGELLGEEHDLAVLGERVRAGSESAGKVALGRGTRKLLLRLIARRRRKLRKRALRDGSKLYGHKPKGFVRRVRKAARSG